MSKPQKRPRETEDLSIDPSYQHKGKRPRPAESPLTHTQHQDVPTSLSASRCDHIGHWASEGQTWPAEFFKEDKMHRLYARQTSSAGLLRRKRSEASLATSTPTDLKEDRSDVPYRNPQYQTLIEKHAGSYMRPNQEGITKASKDMCQRLLDNEQVAPENTIFRDDVFEEACQRLVNKNEARIFQDCTPLIAPSAETHALLTGRSEVDVAIESVNEGWNSSIPIIRPRPQPDYAVGFRRSAFSEEQLEMLEPYIGSPSSASYFMGTFYMHFPFFTCEVKSSLQALEVAQQQNLHSMTLAVRGVVELFRLVGRVEEVHREVLAFSIEHDQKTVMIWGHYPAIDGDKTTYWRHAIRGFLFTDSDGAEKWTAYTFVKNLYDIWMPLHFQRICSAIDQIPATLDNDPPEPAEPEPEKPSGLSQQPSHQWLAEVASQSGRVDVQQMTPDTSTHVEVPGPKRRKG